MTALNHASTTNVDTNHIHNFGNILLSYKHAWTEGERAWITNNLKEIDDVMSIDDIKALPFDCNFLINKFLIIYVYLSYGADVFVWDADLYYDPHHYCYIKLKIGYHIGNAFFYVGFFPLCLTKLRRVEHVLSKEEIEAFWRDTNGHYEEFGTNIITKLKSDITKKRRTEIFDNIVGAIDMPFTADIDIRFMLNDIFGRASVKPNCNAPCIYFNGG